MQIMTNVGRIIAGVWIFSAPVSSIAQVISGNVTDGATGKPLGSVNVYLHKAADSSVVTGTVTANDGGFSIRGFPPDAYYLRFSVLSYMPRVIAPVQMHTGADSLDIGTVALKETPIDLKEVVVTGEKPLIVQDIDRKVYTVEKDIASSSGSASDILRNIPSVDVDIDGNVSLRGSPDVVILINGKNSPMMGRNQAEVLQQMPANAIERIEVITNPSARYRPDGTAGIINIAMRKDAEDGVNGLTSAHAGRGGRYGANLRLNIRPGASNFFSSYSVRHDVRNRWYTDTRMQNGATPAASMYREQGISSASPLSHMALLGAEHEFGSRTTASVSGNYFVNTMSMHDLTRIALDDGAASRSERSTEEMSSEEEIGIRAAVEHKLPGDGHVLQLDLQSSREGETEQTLAQTLFGSAALPTAGERVSNRQTEQSTEVTADYANTFGEGKRLESGYVGEFTGYDSDASGESFDATLNVFAQDAGLTNRFLLDQTLHALYVTFRGAFEPFSAVGGLRAEKVFRKSNLVTTGTAVQSDYAALYPSLHLSYRASPLLELQLNYSRRTHRPHADDLNPFPEYRDPRNVSVGNPRLLPEYINSCEAGLKLEHPLFTVVPSLYYRYTTNRFTTVVRPLNDSTLVTTEENLADDRSAGLEVVGTASIRNLFSVSATWNGFYNVIDATNLGYRSSRSVWSWSGSLVGNFTIGPSTMVQVNGNYRSALLTPQGRLSPSGTVNLGMRQDFWNRRVAATLTIADIFQTTRRELNLESPELQQHSLGTRDSRVFVLGLTFRFGTQQNEKDEDPLPYDDAVE